jgi:hypothetical protein
VQTLKLQRGFSFYEELVLALPVLVLSVVLFVWLASGEQPEKGIWPVETITAPVTHIELVSVRKSEGGTEQGSRQTWNSFQAGGYQVLNGTAEAGTPCATLHRQKVEGQPLSDVPLETLTRAAGTDAVAALTVWVPRPSEGVTAQNCSRFVTKVDHFEYEGLTVAYLARFDIVKRDPPK